MKQTTFLFDQLSIDGDSQVCKVLAGPTNRKALTLANGKAGSLIVPLLFLRHATLRGEDIQSRFEEKHSEVHKKKGFESMLTNEISPSPDRVGVLPS